MATGNLLAINPTNPQARLLDPVVELLKNDGVIIYPTDTVYALGCDITRRKAVERVSRIKGIQPDKAQFSCICADVSILSDYAAGITTPVYKLMKAALPGPYTFVVKASKNIPKHFQSSKKTIGIRVSDHPIPTELATRLGNPILTTSLHDEEDYLAEYLTDPHVMLERYGKLVDAVIDGGFGGNRPSTVIDVSGGEDAIVVLREGAGPLDPLNLVVEDER